jgi:hypothetical protein
MEQNITTSRKNISGTAGLLKADEFFPFIYSNPFLPWPSSFNSITTEAIDQQVYVTLSARTVNKICSALQLFGFNSRKIMPELLKLKIHCRYSDIICDNLPKIIQAIFNKNNGVTEICSDDIVYAIKIFIYLIITDRISDAIITVGMGASDSVPSLRLPAYIIPAIKVVKDIRMGNRIAAIPKVRVFKASHAGAYVNGMDLTTVRGITDITLRFLQDFVDTFFPEIASSFIFESDIDYKNTPIYSKILKVSQIIGDLTGLDDEFTSLHMMGAKHGGENGLENSFFYAAAHPFYNQSVIAKDIDNSISSFTITNPNPALIMDLGGRPQKIFNAVILKLRSVLNPEEYTFPALVNCIVKSGKVPVYYQARKGDILLSDKCFSIDDFVKDPYTDSDYELIFNEISEKEYLSFVDTFKEKTKI